ncbi:hypothetical protein BDR03DRAFT_1014964 [Suillus americanus]|nr:hypothetical protein BDR03DRAFT_1014964 [Suillus americanus]
MPRPATRPGNANKHPGQIVLEASHVARPKDVIAAERKKASAEKSAKAIALEDAQKKVAATEDAMAVEQMAQRAGPGCLVRPKPKLRPVTKAALTANPDKTHKPYAIQCCCKTYQFFVIYTAVGAKPVSKSTDAPKKKYPGLKLIFKDGVNANRKVSNNGTSSTTCIVLSAGRGSDSGKNRRSLGSEHAISTEEVEVGKWAKSVASKSQRKPSAPPSARASVIASRDADISEDENLPEDHDESVTVSWGSQIIDSLDFGLPGYQMALALTTAAAERALILACDDLIVEDTSDHGKHKIALTLNQSTNKMSNAGTTFSAGNWETDTLAYMERIEELPFDRIKEIVERSQAYMKCAHRKDESTILDGETPVNPRTRIRI